MKPEKRFFLCPEGDHIGKHIQSLNLLFHEVISLPPQAQNVLPGQLSLPSTAHTSSPPHEGFPYSSGPQALSFPTARASPWA